MRRYTVTVRLHTCPVKHSLQQATVEASNPATAVNRGLREILARPGVKGRRHGKLELVLVPHANAAAAEEPADG